MQRSRDWPCIPPATSRPTIATVCATPACALPANAQGEKALPEQVKVVIGGQEVNVTEVHVRTQGVPEP